MSTTSIQTDTTRNDDLAKERNMAAASADQGDDVNELHEQAIEAIKYRISGFRGPDQARKEMEDREMSVYEDAKRRRGARQAAMDQLQGAIGLPVDPVLRQRAVEERIDSGAAAMTAQSGSGTFDSNIGGPVPVVDTYYGDQRLPEFNSAVKQGHGANIAAQVAAVETLLAVNPNAPLTRENVLNPEATREDSNEGDRANAGAVGDTTGTRSAPDLGASNAGGDALVNSTNRVDQRGPAPSQENVVRTGPIGDDPATIYDKDAANKPQQDVKPKDEEKPTAEASLTDEQRAERDRLVKGTTIE